MRRQPNRPSWLRIERPMGWPPSECPDEPGNEIAVADRLVTAGVHVLDDVWPRRFLSEERALRLARWCHRERVEAYVVSVS